MVVACLSTQHSTLQPAQRWVRSSEVPPHFATTAIEQALLLERASSTAVGQSQKRLAVTVDPTNTGARNAMIAVSRGCLAAVGSTCKNYGQSIAVFVNSASTADDVAVSSTIRESGSTCLVVTPSRVDTSKADRGMVSPLQSLPSPLLRIRPLSVCLSAT